MPTTAQRNHPSESVNGRTLSITYRVVETAGAFLTIDAALDAAVAAATTDYGIEAIDASLQRDTASEINVTVELSLVQYYDYLAFKAANPSGTYTPKITSDRTARILPPQPIELLQAFAVNQKQPSAQPDTLLLSLGKDEDPTQPWARYPPQENYAETFNVPKSLLTDAMFFTLSKMAHKLNQSPMMLGGVAWPAETVMLLAGSMQAAQNGGGQLALSFAIGEEYDLDWVRTGVGVGGEPGLPFDETMSGIKPFSKLTYYHKTIAATDDAPAQVNYLGLWEHRVWPLSDAYTSFFGAPPEE